ncbi:DUF4336 domain-containing protein [Enhydrobacter aerosaccus]|nr:DUF4336 domain-containing protein [Enhydrobacter aerosaccus]
MQTSTPFVYPPLDTLKRVANDVWIVDGPLIRFGPPGLKMPFPTRMTVIRQSGALFIHSPTPLMPDLRTELEALGQPRWIVGPNRLHYWWIPDWHRAFPGADVYLAPRIVEQARGRIDFAYRPLDRDQGYSWDTFITTLRVAGSFMTEVIFFHQPSRTLLAADLIENFETEKVPFLWVRGLMWLGGVLAPDGQMPRDMRLSYRGQRAALRQAVKRMIALAPDRIIIAHGRWFESDGTAQLQRAFRWLL